jgi:hypothetical protein
VARGRARGARARGAGAWRGRGSIPGEGVQINDAWRLSRKPQRGSPEEIVFLVVVPGVAVRAMAGRAVSAARV